MKPKLTPEIADEAIRLVKGGASNADVIAWLGVAESTFYAWIRDPKNKAQQKLSQGLKKADTERKLWHLQRIHKAADSGHWQASAWYLERRYPEEFARPEVQLANKAAEDAAEKTIVKMADVLVTIRETAENA